MQILFEFVLNKMRITLRKFNVQTKIFHKVTSFRIDQKKVTIYYDDNETYETYMQSQERIILCEENNEGDPKECLGEVVF